MLKKVLFLVVVLSMVSLMLPACGPTPTEAPAAPTEAPPAPPAAETIKIGFDIPLTGDIPKVGEGSRYAGEMMLEKVNGAGGLDVGGKKYQLEFIYEDNESKAESATAAALKLITTDKVLAIIGPQASKQAVPTGEVAETNKTPMVSPWSTNPRTTKDRPYVFRACFLDPFQGPVAAGFATDEFGATKAAVLYDVASDYPKGLAEFFKAAFEELHGEGSVVAFETFTTKDRDFSAQLTKIVASDADFLFTPQYYDEVPLIVKQAHELGWDKPILGSDSWGSAELMTLCGDDCKGSFFSTHYAAAGAKGATKEFIDAYNAKYGYVPDDVAALTWDAMGILLQAIQNTGGLTGDLEKDRAAVKDELGKVKGFDGITGKMTFTPDGDPIKCAVIVKISDAGEFEFYKSACPPEEKEAAPAPAEGKPIVIGLQAPITGEYAYEGEGFVKVLELAVEQKNAAGGILGRPIEIVKCDDVGKPDESSKCAQQLVSEGVDAVVGSYSSTCTEPASAIYNEANILQVTPSSTATRLTTHGYGQFFRVCFLDDRQGLFAAKFIKQDLGIDKAAFLHDNSTYAQGLAEWAKKYYEEEQGGTSVFYDAINPEDTDFTPILTKIMEANPGAVYFTGYHPQGGLLLKQSKDLGAEWEWVMGNACNNPEMIEISGKEAAAGAYVTTEPLPKDIAYPEAQAFVEAYKAKYGEDLTSIWWLMVADAFNVVAAAMEGSGGTDTDAMAQYLLTELKDYPGVTGPILGYDEKGDRLGTVHVAYVISADGEFVPYGEEAAAAPTELEEGPPIKIGFDIPMTGDIPKVGEGSKFAGEMMLEKVNGAGGLAVGNKRHMLEFVYEDNESKAESATAAALKLITTDKVLAIVGPQASKQAVPTGEIAETNMTPMVSPWSTNPRTTEDRPYVFRACFLDPFQGPVAANFATDEFGATKAAVLYDVASDYPKGLAEFFKAAFEELHGEGSVVAFETFTTKDRDFSAQLTKIVASDADFLFTPQYYDEVPLIVKQAHELGWDKPILGSDSWGSAELMNLCGDDCKGSFFSTHYAAAGAKGATKEFIDAYNAKYGYVPDDVAALTWDAMGILLQAIQNTGGLTGDLEKDREAVKDELGKVKGFDGITGKMTFTPDGDPIKCAVIVKISDAGEFEFYKSACP